MRRAPLTAKMKIASLLYHNDIECPLCGVYLMASEKIEWDHFRALGLGGTHDYLNIEAVHAECHRQKTFGAAATTAGSDIGKIAKTRRLEKLRLGTAKAKPKRKWPKRKMR
jgi:hypothetical protein